MTQDNDDNNIIENNVLEYLTKLGDYARMREISDKVFTLRSSKITPEIQKEIQTLLAERKFLRDRNLKLV